MELTVPSTWQISVEMAFGALIFVMTAVWFARAAYGKVMGAIGELKVKIDNIEHRNMGADRDAADLARRLQTTEIAQAVQTAQMTAVMQTVDKMDRNVTEMIRMLTEEKRL